MHGSYNLSLVAVSIAIAIVASYTALDLAGRITAAKGHVRWAWLTGGAVALGVGIWSMHFVGMLAFQLSVGMSYDVPLMILSVGVAIGAAALALWTVSGQELSHRSLLRAGLVMGVAIAGMHYIGMAAMRVDAHVTYTWGLFILSILIAVIASFAALWLAFRFRNDYTWLGRWRKVGSAVLMGMAIAGMHYTGMAAAQFTAIPRGQAPGQHIGMSSMYETELASAVAIATTLILTLALGCATIDRRARAAALVWERDRLLQINEETERRVQERTRELSAALAAAQVANRSKTEFLDRMSHELLTPLNSVIGFANALGKNKDGGFREHDLIVLQRISANGQRLRLLIDSILDLSNIEAGQTDLLLVSTVLDTVVYDVVEQFQEMARNRLIELRADIPSHVAAIDTDAKKVRRVLINLVDNALKFTETGTVTIQLLIDPVSARPRRIEVTDTGIGIPTDRQQTIFEPFEQVDNSTARKFEGAGLGLTLSRALCDQLGYQLAVTSTVGYGTTFIIDIPAIEEDCETSASAGHTSGRPAQHTFPNGLV